MRRFVSLYTDKDGVQWAGPDFWALTPEEAMIQAMEYPIQPIEVVGEFVEVVENDGLDIHVKYLPLERRIH